MSLNPDVYQGKRVLITGGLGFIGSNIAHRLVALGAEVTVLDACIEPYGWNKENIREIENTVRFIRGDVRDKSALNCVLRDQEIVFHMAAQVGREISMEQPDLDAQINCVGTLNVLETARRLERVPKIVYAGSRGQVGEPQYMPVDEAHPDAPTDVYGINKLAAEKYGLLYHVVYGLPFTSLRLNNVYGPRCQMHANFYGILNWFMANVMQDRPITVYGEGTQTRDYVYVADVVDAFIRAGVMPETDGEVYYVGSGRETVFLDMANEIVRAAGKGEIVHVPFPEAREKIDIKKFVVTTEKLRKATGWQMQTELRSGVEKTFSYYRDRLGMYLSR